MKRPSFQFYPADWRKDAALQSCSLAAQGLWVNVMCIAHECDPYGHLTVNGRAMTAAQVARLVGLTEKECRRLLAELEQAGVSSLAADGAIFSRRMVRDEETREKRAAGGKEGAEHGVKGGHHGVKGGRPKGSGGGIKNPPSEDSEPPKEPPPSSSSSSSPSGTLEAGASSSEPVGSDPPKRRSSDVPPCPHKAILALWTEVLPSHPQHNPDLWDGDRADHLRARWKWAAERRHWKTQEEGLAWFRKLFLHIAESPFLSGKVAPREGRRPFVATLAFIVRAEKWRMLLEGEYHGDGVHDEAEEPA